MATCICDKEENVFIPILVMGSLVFLKIFKWNYFTLRNQIGLCEKNSHHDKKNHAMHETLYITLNCSEVDYLLSIISALKKNK